ncbi:hypothetical protein A3D23_01985 [candidate division WOR-1 bacterium RIFCSPHIGHO2_02_FULL_53_26]|nr:MAG: hypothetical protein A3D23_01985 [candidate division WOR-1 bacterium RIFCSPHIGHO2_02_FULL_53_26]
MEKAASIRGPFYLIPMHRKVVITARARAIVDNFSADQLAILGRFFRNKIDSLLALIAQDGSSRERMLLAGTDLWTRGLEANQLRSVLYAGHPEIDALLKDHKLELYIFGGTRLALISSEDLGNEETKPAKQSAPYPRTAENIFQTATVIDGYDKGCLGHFLTTDQPGRIFRRDYAISQTRWQYAVRGRRYAIEGLGELRNLYLAIREETDVATRHLVKKLYGWSDKRYWGEIEYAAIEYIVARKVGGAWVVCDKPVTQTSQSPLQEKKRANRRMIDFLLQDAGERTHKRYWTVYHPGTEQRRGLHTGYLFVPGSARPQLLSGYAAYDQVFVIIHEQINPKTKRPEKIMSVYADEDQTAGEPLGAYRVAVKALKQWQLLEPFVVLSRAGGQAAHRAPIAALKNFLLTDQAPNACLEMPEWKVSSNGCLQIYFDGGSLVLYVGARRRGQKIFGVLKQSGDQKFAWLHESRAAFQENKPPLKAEGLLVAERRAGAWQLVKTRNAALRSKHAATVQHGSALFADQGDALLFSTWAATKRHSQGATVEFLKSLRGQRVMLSHLPLAPLPAEVFCVAREIGSLSKFKLADFYPDRAAFERGDRPLKTAFLTARPAGEARWRHFVFDLDSKNRFDPSQLTDAALVELLHNQEIKRRFPGFHLHLKIEAYRHLALRYGDPLLRSWLVGWL